MADQVITFSDDALAVLGAMTYDPAATFSYDHFAGGFLWSDEFPDTSSHDWNVVSHDYVYRYLIRIRRCITLDDANLSSLPLWRRVLDFAPNWPGLRADRREGTIVKRLHAAERLAEKCLKDLDDELSDLDGDL